MSARNIVVYYAWSRQGERSAPLEVIEDRFPTLFESRRMNYPKYHEWSDPQRFDQSIAGFLDHIMKPNFAMFAELATALTGHRVVEIERQADDGTLTPLDTRLLAAADTLIVISFDSNRTAQHASIGEIEALKTFLEHPDHLAFVCPHHDIGDAASTSDAERLERQLGEFLHHGDKTIPPRQQFGGFARSLLSALGVPVENRFGLRPAVAPDGSPAPVDIDAAIDRLGLLEGVRHFNLHAHLPHLERVAGTVSKLDVLARQHIDLAAPPHPFTRERSTFDALLQSRKDVFAGTLLVSDTTLWSSTAGGVDSLRRLWTNVVQRADRT